MPTKSVQLVTVGPVPPGLLRELEEPLLTQVQVSTVPVEETSTRSSALIGSWFTGSNSTGGTTTRPSDVRLPRTRRSRRAPKKAPSTGPVERV